MPYCDGDPGSLYANGYAEHGSGSGQYLDTVYVGTFDGAMRSYSTIHTSSYSYTRNSHDSETYQTIGPCQFRKYGHADRHKESHNNVSTTYTMADGSLPVIWSWDELRDELLIPDPTP